MTDCKILQLAQRCENMQQERDEFVSSLIDNRYVSADLFAELLESFHGLSIIIDEISAALKVEEKNIIKITNLHESIANGVDINI